VGAGDGAAARGWLEAALQCPENLGEARHPLASAGDIYYWLGEVAEGAGDHAEARGWWTRAAGDRDRFYAGLALRRLDRNAEAESLFGALLDESRQLDAAEPRIDYFATSLPAMLLFHDDPAKSHRIAARLLEAQACLGLGRRADARAAIGQVLALDASHADALDLRRMFL